MNSTVLSFATSTSAAFVSAIALALVFPLNAAEALAPAQKAAKAAANLPRGCIVTATWTGVSPAACTLSGKQEPTGVPPEKILFEIGSISKVFTGLLLAQAVIEKKLTLDTTL